MLEEDFIKQHFLKLYAKLKGNTHGIQQQTHADDSGTRDFEKKNVACPCALKKKKQNKVKGGFR